MSELRTLIRNSVYERKQLIATTIRLPIEKTQWIEEFAEQLSLSKQATILKLIDQGIKYVEETMAEMHEAEGEPPPSKFHLLNTNQRYCHELHERMLNEGIAAAVCTPWKLNIERILKDHMVFLYENGKGIVAYGRGTGVLLKDEFDGKEDECFYQKLNDFKVLADALPAKRIKEILDRNVVFLRTMAGMPDGEKILAEIKKMKVKSS